MAHIIEELKQSKIVKVTYQDGVTMEERLYVVHEICLDYLISSKLKLMIDVRSASQEMTLLEQNIFGQYLASREDFKMAKVAIISDKARNINEVITKESSVLGHEIKHFINEKQAISWFDS